MTDLSDCSKNLICKELDSAVKAVISDFSSTRSVSDEVTQSLCNVLEAIFIHGLNDAFFLRGSRYSKYPEPNFWPFVSKFTHRNIRNQIANLKQIRNEVGRARAWVRIVLNEGALENYISVILADKNQLRVFYQKSAFVRDIERAEVFHDYLKSLKMLKIVAPTNSSFLNSWTPTPLIMAGLCDSRGVMTTVSALKSKRLPNNASSSSFVVDEGGANEATSAIEVGVNANEYLTANKFNKMDSQTSLFSVDSPQTESLPDEDEDKSSTYSHPSLLDGGICTVRPGFNLVLSSTPEGQHQILPDLLNTCYPIEEQSTEVIVRRRKTRLRKVSRHSDGRPKSGNNSGELSRSDSASTLAEKAKQTTLMEEKKADIKNGSLDSKEPSDSGYEQTTDNDERKMSPSMSISIGEPSRTFLSGETTSAMNILSDATYNNEQSFGGVASLHDELSAANLTVESIATTVTSSSVSPLNYSSLVFQRRNCSSAMDSEADPSCSSSLDTDVSVLVGSFNTALRGAIEKTDLFYDGDDDDATLSRKKSSLKQFEATYENKKDSQCSSTAFFPTFTDDANTNSLSKNDEKLIEVSAKVKANNNNNKSSWSSPTEKLIRKLEKNKIQKEEDNFVSDRKESISIKNLPQLEAFDNETKSSKTFITNEEVILDTLKRNVELFYMPLERDSLLDDDMVVVEQSALLEVDEYGISEDLTRFTQIPIEQGLDAQDFRCPSCRKSIGGSFGSFKLCNLDCRYYCEDCWHRGDESLIPARVVWNWDCRRRPVCKASKNFLKLIADRPFIRIDKLNSTLYDHSKPLERIRNLRIKLSLAVMYLLSCKQTVAEDIRRRIFPHDYYHNDIHLYSIMDLEGVLSGLMEKRLNTLIAFCVGHIDGCPLCFQKGFVCEICQSRRVIYPFQTDIAYRCKDCFGVYHLECVETRECPKCQRRATFSSADFQPFSPPPL